MDTMQDIFSSDSISILDIVFTLLIIAITIGLTIFLNRLLKNLFKIPVKKVSPSLVSSMYRAARWPILVSVLLLGLYLSLLFLPWSEQGFKYLSSAAAISAVAVVIYLIAALIMAILKWYEDKEANRPKMGMANKLIPVARILVFLLSLFSLTLITLEILGFEATLITDWMGQYGWRILFILITGIILIMAAGRFIPGIINSTISRYPGESKSETKKRAQTLSRVLVNVAQIIVVVTVVFLILTEVNIIKDITAILAGVGVIGVAVGFGAQSLVKDLLAGLFIIMENQYRVGDVTSVAGVTGMVEDISLRRTVLRDLNGTLHYVPNGEIRVASNMTKGWSRVNLDIEVSYKEDLEKVTPIINRVGEQMAEEPEWKARIISPPKVLYVKSFEPSGILIKILGDTIPAAQWDVTGELRKRLKAAFDKEGIEIPVPHTKVFFGDKPGTLYEPPDKE